MTLKLGLASWPGHHGFHKRGELLARPHHSTMQLLQPSEEAYKHGGLLLLSVLYQ